MLNSRKSLEIILSEIEKEVERDLDFNKKRSNITELHQSVPESLKTRLLKILPAEIFLGDETFEEDKTKMKTIEPDLQKEIQKHLPTTDDILEERDVSVAEALDLMQKAYQEVKLSNADLDDGHPVRRRMNEKKWNWISDYVKKLKRHRVHWNSKLYRENPKNWQKKSLIENVEMMIDLSAAEFANWCNSLASEEQAKTVTPDLIKEFFSIGTEGTAPRGLHVEPVDLHILPSVVIRRFDDTLSSPLDLEIKMNRLRGQDSVANGKPEREHAFGRSLPKELKQKRRVGVAEDMKPVFPVDLQTKEALFRSIEHLQVTRDIFDHIDKEDQFPVPDYLRKNSLFNRSKPA